MNSIPADLITPKQAARILGRHISSIHRWIQTGKLKAWRIGGERYQVSEAEVRAKIRPYTPPVLPMPKEEVGRSHEEACAVLRARGVLRD